jgi:uncharacterized protein
MNKYFIKTPLKYTGKELAPHWIYKNFDIVGDSIVGFIGECEVKLDNMVDISDVLSNSPIYSTKMLHFIVEHFNIPLVEGVLRQRLLVGIAKEVISSNLVHDKSIIRRGDDLFFEGGKLSVSIATASLTSVLIHFGINIDSAKAPVKAAGLVTELQLDNIENIAYNIMEKYLEENNQIMTASCKVRGVY